MRIRHSALVLAAVAGLVLCDACGGDSGRPDAGVGPEDAAAGADGNEAAADDAGSQGTAAPLSTLTCELAERPGPVPQPPATLVDDFGQPVRLPDSFNDACPNDAIEVSPDGARIYYHYSVNLLDLLIQEGRHVQGTEVRFKDLQEDGTFGPARVLDLRRDDPSAMPGETRVAPDGSWVIWHALSAQNYGYVDGLPDGQTYDLDLFEAPMSREVPGTSVHLGREVNSRYLEAEHWATADGRTIYFASNRPGNLGAVSTTDIWSVTRSTAGAWGETAHLPSPVNSSANELQPTISPDGQWLYFASDRDGAGAIWRAPILGDGTFGIAEKVIAPFVGEPSFAADGRLFFVHVEIDFSVTPAAVYDSDVYLVSPQ
jgi:hypothetical protein